MKRVLGVVFAISLFSIGSWSQTDSVDEFEEFDRPQQDQVFDLPNQENQARPEKLSEPDGPFEIGNKSEAENGSQTENSNQTKSSAETESTVTDDTVMVRTKEEIPTFENPSELVEVRTARDIYLPYKQRQNNWGFVFSLGAEVADFPELLTQVGIENGDDYSFHEMFGRDGIRMLNIEAGPKYNLSWGSIALVGGYSYFKESSDSLSARVTGAPYQVSEITFSRVSASLIYYLDMLTTEAYIIPYVGAGGWQADYSETSSYYPDRTERYSTQIGTQFRFGALLGLDWIEADASRISRKKNGTQGTFLNVYGISTQMSEANADPNLENELDLGASLIFEF